MENKKKRIYYAHNMMTYGSQRELDDVKLLEDMGFEVVNPNSPGNEEKYLEKRAFGFFLDLVKDCDCLAFRGYFGKITHGTGKEIQYALEKKMPVIELPYLTSTRYLSKEETNEYFRPRGTKE